MFDQTLRQQFGHGEDRRVKNEETDPWAISKNSEDLIDSMLNLIVNHKKALKVIPQCSHPDTAREWANKRGLSVSTPDLDNDPATQEVVVWDKSGKRPYVVNGYKLTKSDYPTRNAYWGSHKTAEERVEEPMDEWIENEVYNIKKRPDNKWVNDSIGLGEVGHQIERYGYGLPTKPKKMMTPYAVFSKLIAPMVKKMFNQKEFYSRFGITSNGDNVAYPAALLRKIISPISIYRVLYLRLVEQKYCFMLSINQNGGNLINYDAFKKHMKNDHVKADFYKWFYNNYLTGPQKEDFNDEVISLNIIVQNLIPGNITNENVNDPVHILLNLLGIANWVNNEPFFSDDQSSYTLLNTLRSDDLSKRALKILEQKEHPNHKSLKRNLQKAKIISQQSCERYLSKENVARIVSNLTAFRKFIQSMEMTGTPNNIPPSPQNPAGGSDVPPIQGAAMNVPQESVEAVRDRSQRTMDEFFGPE